MRPDWIKYFMEITNLVATRSTCLRRSVGAVIVRDNRILTTGYNGVPRKLPHCDEVGCLRERLSIPSGERQELCRGIHAEQNAIIQAAVNGIVIEGGILFCTHQPCITCTKMIINSGIKRVYIANPYPDKLGEEMLKEAGVPIETV
ncbi:MAG: deoxycytidylate deaminase [Candidatus Muiribacteriaceae bacterium]